MNTQVKLTHSHAKMLAKRPTYKVLGNLNAIVKLFKDKISAKEIANMFPEYFPVNEPNKIYKVKAALIQLGLAEKCPIALKMVATKRRLLEEVKSNVTPISESTQPIEPIKAIKATKATKSVSSTIKIKFHGVMLEIEKSSHIIITREQIVVQ